MVRGLPKKTDFGCPSRVPNTYMLYSHQVRNGVMEELKATGEFELANVAKKISLMWKDVTAAEKEKLQEEVEKLKVTFQKELGEWEQGEGPQKFEQALKLFRNRETNRNLLKTKKESGMPTKPQAPYLAFQNQRVEDVKRICGERNIPWRQRDIIVKELWELEGEDGKQKHQKDYDQKRQEYQAALEEWKNTDGAKAIEADVVAQKQKTAKKESAAKRRKIKEVSVESASEAAVTEAPGTESNISEPPVSVSEPPVSNVSEPPVSNVSEVIEVSSESL